MNKNIHIFTKGKVSNKNEDIFVYDENNFIIIDGATDKSGNTYGGKTGGEIISQELAQEALKTKLNGIDLIDYLNKKVKKLYTIYNIKNYKSFPELRFTCGGIFVRKLGKRLCITYIGDLGFRINAQDIYQEIKKIDIINSQKRADYIKITGDIEGGRKYIQGDLVGQYKYQNNSNHPLGYGVIDGTSTPGKFIKTFEFNIKDIRSLELFTDGYFKIPEGISIQDWERAYEKVEREDPYKYKKYVSTKTADDRTIAIITF